MPVSRHEVPFVARTPLQRASADGDAQAVVTLLKAAHDGGSLEQALLHAEGDHSLTPLVWTALMGHSNIAQLLLTHMPDRQVLQPASFGYTALTVAAKLGNAVLCRQLLQFKPEQQLMHAIERTGFSEYDNATALMFAAGHGHMDVVETLLTCIPERQVLYQTCKHISALYMAISSGFSDIVALLLQHVPAQQLRMQHGHGFTALHLAARLGDERIVQQLLAAHDPAQQVVRVDQDGTMPIHLAASNGSTGVIRQLLAHSPEQQLSHKDADGYTAMLCAAAYRHVAVMQLLLSCAREPVQLVQQCNRKLYTPLMVAAERGFTAAVQLLLQHSPDWQVQQVNKEGGNALILAVVAARDMSLYRSSLEVIRVLLRHSPEAQVQQVSYYGWNALAFAHAMKQNQLDIVRELLQHCPDQQVTAGHPLGDSPLCLAVKMGYVDFVKEVASRVTDPAALALGLMGATFAASEYSTAATSAIFAKAQLRCCQLLLAAGADPTTLTPEQLSAFGRARPGVQNLVQEACRRANRRRKGQRPAQNERAKAETEQAEARAEQAAAALLAEEEADRAKAQAAQAKKDKKKQKKATGKAREAAAQAEAAGQEDTTGAVGVEACEVAAAIRLSAAGPSAGSGSSGGSGPHDNGGGDCSRGGGSDDVGGSCSASSSKGGSTSALVETLRGTDICALPVAPGAQRSSNAESDRWCVVCLERHSCRALVPCGHIVMCGPCCEAVQAAKNECPMCREGILAVLAINTANL